MYEQRDDWAFRRKVGMTILLGVVLVCAGLGLTLWLELPGWVVIAVCVATGAVPIAIIIKRFKTTRCPNCGDEILVPWQDPEYLAGGMLKYRCDRCRIEWRTHIYPGSDAS